MNEPRRQIRGRRIAIFGSWNRNGFDEFEEKKWYVYVEFIVKVKLEVTKEPCIALKREPPNTPATPNM
jgi:hypothetical protein